MRKQFSQNSWFYALGGIGRDMAAAGLFLNYLLPYALVTKNLSQQAFLGLSGIMACGRLLEAVLDPLMGSVLDNTQTRWGPFKPWLLIGTLGTAITIVISFSNQWQGGAYLVAFSILYLGFDIFFTMNDVTYWAILPTLSSDQHERNWVTSLSALMAGVGAFLTNLLVPFLTIGSHAWGGNAITGYARVAVAFTFVLLFCQSLVLFGVHQHPMSRHKQRRAQQLWRQVYQTFRQNDQIRWNALLLLLYMGVNTCSTMVLPFYLYLRFGYSGLWPMIVTALGQVATAGLYLFFNRIANRYARKTLIHCATLLDVGGVRCIIATWFIGATAV
ncbi:MFS transporter [Loigolactobacillus bifermentans]|uniref:MFS transporter n=1 Tax=Loigolactobacillus bifermentans DSM 20003 TaxID=1423726 RepID=A0A0R1GQT3_9LACO|nr:MFS transporter [Loigolactobacillus bifermentans]KRK36427.1 hypothetical protein FC07_GL003037 [Loigolactobacillus bifermentans DSM 20003]QGG60633.1 hypothetical protein LB003_09245 [Loigolactobacillus bifermentans]